jgi:BirA family biotin operon repressor/biotin-[acetyl-CoA-carboxylase] ligase
MNKSRSLLRAESLLQEISSQGDGRSITFNDQADRDLLHQLIGMSLPLKEPTEGAFVLASDAEGLAPETILSFVSNQDQSQLNGIQCLKIIDSTNSYLLRSELPAEGFRLATAECQVGGKGRRGNQWISPYGRHLYLSVAYRLDDLSGVEVIPLNVALALRERLMNLGFQGVGLKWPNDLYHNGQKLGGILLETIKDRAGWKLVVGIGINLKEDQELINDIEQPVTYLDALMPGHQYGRNELVANILESIIEAAASIVRGKALQKRWCAADICQDRKVRVITESGELMGVGGGIDEQGAFVLKTKNKNMTFHSGEISLRLQ